MSLQHFLNPFAKKYSITDLQLFSFLRGNDILSVLKDDEMADIVPHLYVRNYNPNEVIFFRNDPSQAFYVIKKGRVRLTVDIESTEEILMELSDGDCFGENSFVGDTLRYYNAICVEEGCELYVLPQVHIFELFEDEPKIKGRILAQLAVYYEKRISRIFRKYREMYGFFEIGKAYFSASSKK